MGLNRVPEAFSFGTLDVGVSKNQGYLFWCPYNRDPTI